MANYRLNEAKMFADVTDGIAIIINSETGIYYGMNEFATQVYEYLQKGVSAEKVLDAIKKVPNIPDYTVENFDMFINILLEKEIMLKTSENTDIEVSFNPEMVKENKYAIELKEYNDAQELLLADPIHEVKESEGWTGEKSSINEDKEDVARREAKMEQ